MPASRRLLSAALVVLVLVAGAVFLRYRSAGPTPPPVPARPIVAAIRAEPRSFNRFAAGDRTTGLLAMLLHARLVQLNQRTQDIEPALATKWTLDPDGRTYTLTSARAWCSRTARRSRPTTSSSPSRPSTIRRRRARSPAACG